MSQQYKAAAAILKGAISTINAILSGPDDEMHRLKLTQTLQREADYLLLVTGAGDLSENQAVVLGPAKTIGGKAINKLPRITERDLKPSDDKVLLFKEDIESALAYFGPDANSAGILANIPDLIVRGVAKKAGLPVTKDNPKELTVEYIDEIKAALLEKGLVVPEEAPKALTEEEINTIGTEVHNLKAEGGKVEDVPPAKETPAENAAPVDFMAKGINPKDESKKKSVGK